MRSVILAGFLVVTPVVMTAQAGPKTLPAPPDVAKAPATAVKTPSGLASRVIAPGTGEGHPKADDLVTVNYTEWTADGKMLDSTLTGGTPKTFPLNHVISGLIEGVQLMVPGETRRFWIPQALAYKGVADHPKGLIVFDVELLAFKDSPEKPPADVKAPPADAQKTASGLSYKILAPGTGARRPLASNTVQVVYSGWTTDGMLFDSSELRGEPMTLAVNGVIPGWTEGLQLMVEGERMRLWIPEALAYKGAAGSPKGMLVFDVELIKIQ